MTDELTVRARYFELMNMNGAAHVYRQARASGMLAALLEGPMTASELARQCEIRERPTRLMLAALHAMGVVAGEDESFSLTALARMLIGGGYRALGDEYWAHLPTLLESDKPLQRMDDVGESESHYRSQAAALAWMLAPAAEAAATALGFGATTADTSILDLGAGSAVWSLTMARRDESSTVTAVDWPAVLAVATSTAERFGLADRLTTLPGNFHQVELPAAAFDLAILGNVTHLESREGNLDVMKRARTSLRTGGRIVIFDVFPGQSKGDLNRTLYALGLALRTESGTVYAPEELEALLAEAGFAAAELVDLPVPPFAVGMMVAEASG